MMKPLIRLLITGGRGYQDEDFVWYILDKILYQRDIELLIVGDATGADALARLWAEARGVPIKVEYADWNRYGDAAGAIRNDDLLTWGPTAVVAFPGGAGTADMIAKARRKKITVWQVSRQGGKVIETPKGLFD